MADNDLIKSHLFSFHEDINNAIQSLSIEQSNRLRADLATNKSIHDILADLAVDKKYDGNQTTNSLTSTETSAIIAKSEATKLSTANSNLSIANSNLSDMRSVINFNNLNSNVQFFPEGELTLNGETSTPLTSEFIRVCQEDSGKFKAVANGLRFEGDNTVVSETRAYFTGQLGLPAISAVYVDVQEQGEVLLMNYPEIPNKTDKFEWVPNVPMLGGRGFYILNPDRKDDQISQADGVIDAYQDTVFGNEVKGRIMLFDSYTNPHTGDGMYTCSTMKNKSITLPKTIVVGPSAKLDIRDITLKAGTKIIVMGNHNHISAVNNILIANDDFISKGFYNTDSKLSLKKGTNSVDGRIKFHNVTVEDQVEISFVNVGASEVSLTGTKNTFTSKVKTYGGDLITKDGLMDNSSPQLVLEKLQDGEYQFSQLYKYDGNTNLQSFLDKGLYLQVTGQGASLKLIRLNHSDKTFTWDETSQTYVYTSATETIVDYFYKDRNLIGATSAWLGGYQSHRYKYITPPISGTFTNNPEGETVVFGDLVITQDDVTTVTTPTPANSLQDTSSADDALSSTSKKVYNKPNLTMVTGSITVAEGVEVDEIIMPKLKKIGKSLDLSKAKNRLSKLDIKELEIVGEDINLDGFKKLKNVDMKKLKRVKNLKVKNTDVLEVLDLDSLEDVTGDIDIEGNKKLNDIKMKKLKDITGNLKIKPPTDETNIKEDKPLKIEIKEELVLKKRKENKTDLGGKMDDKKRMKFMKYNDSSKPHNKHPLDPMDDQTTQDTPAPAGRGQVIVLRRGEGRRAAGRGQVNVLRRGEGRQRRQ